ncbi:complement component 4 binding protein alpha [Phyllostomus discolor]|uniref:Complement component 4 binding protein alpha n=1 Tax=Phyllostomus discolor TaxID=89673 RepID=A0A833YIW8_9CHIR|nr:complement component 4 binding protein alpha [Phyllostomus discolor]
MLEKPQVMNPSRPPNTTLDRKGKSTAWPFSRLWIVFDSTLFQMTLVAALLASVLGDCGPPPHLQFAFPENELNETNYKYGTALKYNCRPGYTRTSSRNTYLICDKKGKWEYYYFCVKKVCNNPGELRNGRVIIKTDYSFGSRIEFDCLEGYILMGPTTSHCELQDKTVGWSNSFPECVIAKCESPPDISNGKYNGGSEDVYTYGSSVTYSCDPSFSMLGEASISCTVVNKTEGVWSPSPPTCERISCSKPDVKNGKILVGFGPNYKYKDSISFGCNKGFILKGSNLIHCGADNNWHPAPPICEINSCTDLPDIPHSSWEIHGYRRPTKGETYEVGTVLRYRCHPGYKPAGNKPTTVACQRNFSWTPYTECEEVCCPVPDLKNGRITTQKKKSLASNCEYFYGDSLWYSCGGIRTVEASCQGDGTWSPDTPTCDESCAYPPHIDHGHFIRIPSYLFQPKEVKYECDEGYTLDGEATLSCSSSRWSAPAPQCKALCPKPEIEHGKVSGDKDQFVESENVTIECTSGYTVVGPQNITCLENHSWYPEVPKCELEFPSGCEQVKAGRKLMQCLPRPEDVKMALEVYKLSLEIERLEREREKARK